MGGSVPQNMPSCMMLTSLPVLALAVLVGYLAGTSPVGISPAHIPGASPLQQVPPWPVFRAAVFVNDLFRGAAEATTLPKIRVLDMATARFQSQVIHILTKNEVFDAVHDAPLSCGAAAAKLRLHEPFLCRLMDAGTSLGLLSKAEDKFSTTDVSALLLRDAEGSLKSFVEMINNPYQHPAWDVIGTGPALRQDLRRGRVRGRHAQAPPQPLPERLRHCFRPPHSRQRGHQGDGGGRSVGTLLRG